MPNAIPTMSLLQPDEEELRRRKEQEGIAPLAMPKIASGVSTPTVAPVNAGRIGEMQKQRDTDVSELDRLKRTGSGISQVHGPIGRGILRGMETAAQILAPRIATAIPGTEAHHNQLVGNATKNVQADEGIIQDEAQTEGLLHPKRDPKQSAYDAAIAAGKDPQAALEDVEGAGKQPKAKIHLSTDQGEFLVDPETNQATPLTYQGQPLKPKTPPRNVQTVQTAEGVFEVKPDGTRGNRLGSPTKALQVNAGERDDAKRIPTEELAQINASLPQGQDAYPIGTTYGQIKTAKVIPHSKKDISKLNLTKVEDRAALADNVKANIAEMRDILQRRPDLFGSFNGGVMTRGKEFFGTGDPDILKWEQAKNNVIKANVGMHNMRSQYALSSDKLLYDFKHDPSAIEGAIAAMESSADQFVQEAAQGGSSAHGGNTSGGGFSVTDPNGKVHPFKSQAEADAFKQLAGIK